jgi:hypothetical protein
MVCFKYITVNILHKGGGGGDHDVQHIHISMQYNFDVARNGHRNPTGTSPGC